MGKCTVKYIIEIEVKDVDRDDIGVVGETLCDHGTKGLSKVKDRPVKRLSCTGESIETHHIPF